MRILHVGRDHAHLEREGVPPLHRRPTRDASDTHFWCVASRPDSVRGLNVDQIVWHEGWADNLTAEQSERVKAAVTPCDVNSARPYIEGTGPIVECETYDVDGRVEVRWPQGRGRVIVSPEVIEGWAEQVNTLRDQLHPAT